MPLNILLREPVQMLKTVLTTARPPFLVLAVSCISLLLATALWLGASLSWLPVSLMALLLFCAHISVNCLNEVEDYCSGLDLNTCKTPFSGGTGALPANPSAVHAARFFGIFCLALATVIGLYLVLITDWYLALLGLLGLLIIVTYTRWINRMPWLCFIAPGIGLSVIPVFGGAWVLGGSPSLMALCISLIPALLINNLLLLNQFPDLVPDKAFGRRTLPVVYGLRFSTSAYLVNWLMAAFLLSLFCVLQILPLLALSVFIPMILGLVAWKGAVAHADELPQHTGFMAANVICALLSPFVLALVLLFSV